MVEMPRLVTPHFSTGEFVQPRDYGLPAEDYPNEWIESRLVPLCNVLEILRNELRGMPIKVISGYRSFEWNKRHHEKHPGAVIHSQHCEGRAADIQVQWFQPLDVHRTVINLYERKLIAIGGLGLYESFVHIDIREGSELARWKG